MKRRKKQKRRQMKRRRLQRRKRRKIKKQKKKTDEKKKVTKKTDDNKKKATKKTDDNKKKVTKKTDDNNKKVTKKTDDNKKKVTKKTDDNNKKVTKKTDNNKKKATVQKKKEETKINIYEKWVSEAIQSISTEENPYVSSLKIKQYLIDYMDQGIFYVIPKRAKKALDSLCEKKLLKSKKNSYAFSSLGKTKLIQEKIPKRKKVTRPIKKTNEVEEKKEEPKEYQTSSGRVSKQTKLI